MGNANTQITFTYTPHTFSTAEAEFEIRTSEFDFKPQQIRVVGSSNPQKLDSQQNQFYGEASLQNDVTVEELNESMQSASNDRVIKRKGRTLLTDKSSRPT